MVRPKINKRQNIWKEDDIEKALHAIQRAGSSIKGAARQYCMAEGTLRNRLKNLKEGKGMVGSGRKTTFTDDHEKSLAECIAVLCKAGFSPSRDEIKNLVRDYVTRNDIKTPFKDNRPGKDWFNNFLQRRRLSTKKAAIISAARKAATGNPFIIYDFYDVISDIIRSKNLKENQIWNCDESGFPTDPHNCRVVAPIGRPGWKTTSGAGRENITVLASCSASGRTLPPLIVFGGKNFQSTWKGKSALPQTMYGISDNGWMTTDVFSDWFDEFCQQVTERPLLLIYDGHLSHVSLPVIRKAIDQDVIIVKFPPHVTDKMQPLDVCCFSPLKRRWEKLLSERANTLGPKETITKSAFVDLLCSIWSEGLSIENAISGFKSTGIYPVNRDKYPVNRLDPRLLKCYEKWVASGKPKAVMEELATAPPTPKKSAPEPTKATDTPIEAENISIEANEPPSDLGNSSIISTVTEQSGPSNRNLSSSSLPSCSFASTPKENRSCRCIVCVKIGPKPPEVPDRVWVPMWSSQLATESSNKSFQELVLDRLKKKESRQYTKVITDETYVKKLEELEQRKKPKPKKQIDFNKEEEDDQVIVEESEEEIEESEEEQYESDEEISTEEILKSLWKSILESKESKVVDKWYGAIYQKDTKRKPQFMLFVGKACHRFRVDVDSPATDLQLNCLEPPIGDTTVLKTVPSTRGQDIGLFPIHNIIMQLEVEPLKGEKWSVPKYMILKDHFHNCIKLDRKELMNTIL